ncbi:MAG: helix-turn-helix transcriptional regulator [Oscillospiraceae bacterium]|nr:helix-turn-helix transcriptional regulator [Oscillospiraceae bacterium]
MKSEYVKHKIANLISINKIVTIHYYEFGRDFSFGGEVHDFWEMVYVDRGRVHITADNRCITLEQGEVAFHKPNEFHTISTDSDIAADVFVISFVCSSSAMSFFKRRVAKVPKKLRENISSIITESAATFNLMPITGVELELKDDAPVGGQQLIRIHLEEFLIMLLRAESKDDTKLFPTKESMENHLVSRVKTILEKNIYRRITVDEICRELNYSRAYLAKIFKNSTGETILAHLLSLKIKAAKRLIREDSLNFTQISDKLAFDNPHYFSRVFKRITNFTPSQYKNSVL